ncbi:MAG TPA: alpha/beta hydrolase [Myxococcota bacterium]|jgi:pimeloyl-ACP methyl ester carboxylesterase
MRGERGRTGWGGAFGLRAAALALVAGLVALYAFAPQVETRVLDERARAGAGGEFIALGDGEVHYELAGPEGAPVVVLLHGFSTPYLIWDFNFPAIAAAGYRVLRYDLYGRGFSDRPATVDYGPELFDRQLLELIQKLGLRTPLTLGGVSMGGAISVLFAERHPELVNGLILVDPAGFPMPTPPALKLLRVPGLGEYLMRLLGDRSIRAGMASNFFDPSLLPAFASKFAVQLEYAGFQRAQLSTLRHMPLETLEASYRTVGAAGTPVLLVWGEADTVIPFETSQRVKAAIPQAELLAVERAAHTPNYERPEVVNPAILGFLARSAAPR